MLCCLINLADVYLWTLSNVSTEAGAQKHRHGFDYAPEQSLCVLWTEQNKCGLDIIYVLSPEFSHVTNYPIIVGKQLYVHA